MIKVSSAKIREREDGCIKWTDLNAQLSIRALRLTMKILLIALIGLAVAVACHQPLDRTKRHVRPVAYEVDKGELLEEENEEQNPHIMPMFAYSVPKVKAHSFRKLIFGNHLIAYFCPQSERDAVYHPSQGALSSHEGREQFLMQLYRLRTALCSR